MATRRARIAWLVMASSGAALLLIGTASTVVTGRDPGSRTGIVGTITNTPPPQETPLAYYWTAPQWDDRELGPDQKLADPIVNPRWAPFARCMSAAGFETRADPAAPFLQADLDAVVATINAAGPPQTLEHGQLITHHTPLVDAYITCKRSTLDVLAENLYTILTPVELETAKAAAFAPADSPPAQGR